MKTLYVTDRAAVGDERFCRLLDALAGAPELTVELREKQAEDGECLAWARLARERLGADVALYVNGRFDIALLAGADGVHLPADGLPFPRVRSHTPRGFRIGVSTHSPEEAEAAIGDGADLVVLGPIFPTPSKPSARPLGPAALGRLPLRATHGCDVFAIGGIDEAAIGDLEPHRDRISGVAGIRLFQEAADARQLVERIAAR